MVVVSDDCVKLYSSVMFVHLFLVFCQYCLLCVSHFFTLFFSYLESYPQPNSQWKVLTSDLWAVLGGVRPCL